MAGSLHFEAPTALEYFATLVADDASLPLLEAAVALAQDDDAGLDVQGVLAQIDALADRLTRRIPPDAPPCSACACSTATSSTSWAFAATSTTTTTAQQPAALRAGHTPGHSDHAGRALHRDGQAGGLAAQGVSFPGHFLVKVPMPRGEVVIDPFTGQSLSREELEERLAPYRRKRRCPMKSRCRWACTCRWRRRAR
jgi:regulator of sirC expression with transglutaminase-like and TPR domain